MLIIRIHEGIGRTIAIAEDDKGQAVSLYIEIDQLLNQRLLWGDVSSGHVRGIEPGSGGVFVEMLNGEAAYWPIRDPDHLKTISEGSECLFRVRTEARRDKRAVVQRVEDDIPDPVSAFDRWATELPGGSSETDSLEDRASVFEVLDDSLSPHIQIDGGGRLTLQRTRALTAIDVDTAGRKQKGSPVDRSFQTNLAAIRSATRALELRQLGGLVVLDCIAPITPNGKPKLAEEFRASWRGISTRHVEVEPPSRFGLVEASIGWRYRPLDEAVLCVDGSAELSWQATDLFDQVLREGESNRTAQLTARITPCLQHFLSETRFDWRGALTGKIGPRFRVEVSDRLLSVPFEVTPT